MRRLPLVVIVLVLILAATLGFPQVRSRVEEALSYSECETPITYKLGNLDPKFGLSKENANKAVHDGAEIWSKSYGKPLFTESPNAELTINFTYDERTALNSAINQQKNKLDQSNLTLEEKIKSFEADLAAFEKKLANFNARVDEINRAGGASPEVYSSLIAEQSELQAQADALNARAKELNLATKDYNSKVGSLNKQVDQFNRSIVLKPEEGLFNADDNTITIYFADNRDELVHTLAHEFGHAREMEHTEDPKSIMYPYSTRYLSVTGEDKEELDYVCREQSLPSRWFREDSLKIQQIFKW